MQLGFDATSTTQLKPVLKLESGTILAFGDKTPDPAIESLDLVLRVVGALYDSN